MSDTILSKRKCWNEICENTFQEARWIALFEAVNLIAEKACERKVPWDQVELKPLDIEKYVESTSNIYQRKLLENDYKIRVEFCDPEHEIPCDKEFETV